jgi:WhiB family transcriptional regulator, redox-sensing transcriptional regulator
VIEPADVRLRNPEDWYKSEWLQYALCGKEDSAYLFFAPDFDHYRQEPIEIRRRRESLAKEVCARCPVSGPCRRYADEMRVADGVWAGENEQERKDRWRAERRKKGGR